MAFGLKWSSSLPLRYFSDSGHAGQADVRIELSHTPLPTRRVMRAFRRNVVYDDGARLSPNGQTAIDVVGTGLITVTPGNDWEGEYPIHLFSTAAAVTLALRGLVPMHGTAVDIAGTAVLICGESGYGKSTLGANLIALGGRLVSDDLSVLRISKKDGVFVLAGRPGMKLHPDTVSALGALLDRSKTVPSVNGKLLAHPPRVDALSELPLGGIVMLGGISPPSYAARLAALCGHMFRPRLMQFLPEQTQRMDLLAHAAKTIPILHFAGLQSYSPQLALEGARRIFDWMGCDPIPFEPFAATTQKIQPSSR
ncbi:hypothetical protein FHS83_002284 [Rhizomicrobium palustre]|uniref:HPr kinase/phosphorylase C-terminal domain-containing protein n=1 Tax=Rhizomicrobium palustre TaxID=189966 RepID=A0A846MZV8_9PROT|nr:hypothetical protein [Rhizomicrobium palustre]